MKLEIEEIAAPRSFVFLWCGSGEGLDLGRVVRWCFNSIYQGQALEFIFIIDSFCIEFSTVTAERSFVTMVEIHNFNWIN